MGKMKTGILSLGLMAALTGGQAFAEDSKEEIAKLRKDLDELSRKVERAERKDGGLADHLSKMHFHGYGELHYNDPKTGTMDDGANPRTDFHRLVLGWGYEFTDRIRMDAEIDFEHNANASDLELEYALLEFDLLTDPKFSVSFRVGALLMPIGPLNEFHEPVNYYSVERPIVETNMIPTTWQENGAGFAGRALDGRIAFRAYLVTGLDASGVGSKPSGFSSTGGIRGGRSKGIKSEADDFAFAGRLEYFTPVKGLTVAGSYYGGNADQGRRGIGTVNVNLYEADARYTRFGFDLRGEYILTTVSNADRLSSFLGTTIGKRQQGYMLEAGYHMFHHVKEHLPSWLENQDLVVFVRREELDTNDEVPSGFAKDYAAHRRIWTTGLAYYPIPKIAFKTDFEFWEDAANDTVTRWNVGMAFMF